MTKLVIYFSKFIYYWMHVNLCARFQIIRSLHFSIITAKWPKNEKWLNAFNPNRTRITHNRGFIYYIVIKILEKIAFISKSNQSTYIYYIPINEILGNFDEIKRLFSFSYFTVKKYFSETYFLCFHWCLAWLLSFFKFCQYTKFKE
jgi:hypothetical protein